jgi:hypothetical protein
VVNRKDAIPKDVNKNLDAKQSELRSPPFTPFLI